MVLIVPIEPLAAMMRPVIGMNAAASENSPLTIAAGEKAMSEPPHVKLVNTLFSMVRRISMSSEAAGSARRWADAPAHIPPTCR